MQTIVTSDQHGQRLDVLIASAMPRLSRAFVRKLCDTDKVRVNGQPAKPGYKAKEDDVITVDYDEAQLDIIPNINLPVLYENTDCIVINKPAGVLTHTQGTFNDEATVATFLRNKIAAAKESGGLTGERAGIVHRLDRATSGVIIGAKNQKALSMLQKQFAQRKTKKTYIAIVKGHLRQPEAIIDMPIERNPRAPATFRVGVNGKAAVTHYRVIETSDTASLIELKPETGRTHQLRVHLAQVGHPIVGDPLYGQGSHGDRLYLHALTLEITLPNRERTSFTAPLPSEFEEYMHA
jgi:23S rRNA pseudouridine1911/1915/1917 synthase